MDGEDEEDDDDDWAMWDGGGYSRREKQPEYRLTVKPHEDLAQIAAAPVRALVWVFTLGRFGRWQFWFVKE